MLLLDGKSSAQISDMGCLQFPSWCKPVVTTVVMLLIINGSLTELEHLYAAMKEAEKMKNCIFKDGKTIISFDLQLYIKAVMLQQRPDIHSGFVFHMGELHVVFCALKVIGKLIDGGGLDQAFHEAGKWILSEKQDIRLMMSVTWFTYACLKPCLNYDISNSHAFVLEHCIHAIHFILRYDIAQVK